MDELRRAQAESTMTQPEFSRSMVEMDHSQVGFHRFLDLDEISQPPQAKLFEDKQNFIFFAWRQAKL